MAFADHLAAIPFVSRTQTGSGFLPPLLRAMSHILYLLGMLAEEGMTVENDRALTELTAARDHWSARDDTVIHQMLSTNAIARCETLAALFSAAVTEFPGWEREAAVTNLRDLANRCLTIAAEMDRELLGLTTSDPGHTL